MKPGENYLETLLKTDLKYFYICASVYCTFSCRYLIVTYEFSKIKHDRIVYEDPIDFYFNVTPKWFKL